MWRGRSSCLYTRHLRRVSSVGKRLSSKCDRVLHGRRRERRRQQQRARGWRCHSVCRCRKRNHHVEHRAWAETGWGRGVVCGCQDHQSRRGGQSRQSLRGRRKCSCRERRRPRQSQSHWPRRRESEPLRQRQVGDDSRTAFWACCSEQAKSKCSPGIPDTLEQLRSLKEVWCAAVKDVNECPGVLYGERSVLQFF